MARVIPTHRSLLLALVLLNVGLVGRVGAQATGEFLCSVPGGASPDGAPCSSDDDCGAGVCVIAQGVCSAPGADDDGFTCDCPAGTCQGTTCVGGTSAGLDCDATTNCSNNQCVGTQKVCLTGDFRGYSCLRNDNCFDGTTHACVSTGRFCADGTDYASYSCVVSADCCSTANCPTDACQGAAAAPTPTRTASRIPTTGTPRPTSTRTPTAPTSTPGTGTPQPTATPTVTATVSMVTPPPTATLPPGTGRGVVAKFAPATSAVLELVDAAGFATRGVIVQIGNQQTSIMYSRCSTCNTLRLRTALGSAVAAGTTVAILAFTPTPGPFGEVFQNSAEGGGCSIDTSGESGRAVLVIGIAVVAVLLRRWGKPCGCPRG